MNCADFPKETIEIKLTEAIKLLFEKDSYLLKYNLNERSITHRFAMYLQQIFDNWHVDCEYNKDYHNNTKRLHIPSKKIGSSNTNGDTIYPDIIIHQRGTNENLVVIEVKKSTNHSDIGYDKKKLKAFKRELGYCYAIFLKLKTGCNDPDVESLDYIEAD